MFATIGVYCIFLNDLQEVSVGDAKELLRNFLLRFEALKGSLHGLPRSFISKVKAVNCMRQIELS